MITLNHYLFVSGLLFAIGLAGVVVRRSILVIYMCLELMLSAANLTLIDLDAEWVAGEHGWESRSENCCFSGRRLRGRVLLTLAAGAVAYRERAFSVVSA